MGDLQEAWSDNQLRYLHLLNDLDNLVILLLLKGPIVSALPFYQLDRGFGGHQQVVDTGVRAWEDQHFFDAFTAIITDPPPVGLAYLGVIAAKVELKLHNHHGVNCAEDVLKCIFPVFALDRAVKVKPFGRVLIYVLHRTELRVLECRVKYGNADELEVVLSASCPLEHRHLAVVLMKEYQLVLDLERTGDRP